MTEMVPSSRAKAKPAYRPESSKQSLPIWNKQDTQYYKVSHPRQELLFHNTIYYTCRHLLDSLPPGPTEGEDHTNKTNLTAVHTVSNRLFCLQHGRLKFSKEIRNHGRTICWLASTVSDISKPLKFFTVLLTKK